MNKITKITLVIISLLPISLFSIDNEEELNDIMPIIEVNGNMMPGWEKDIIERFHDEEGNGLPVVFRNAAKDWIAASWTPEYFAENFGDERIVCIPQLLEEQIRSERVSTTFKDHINDITLNPENALYFEGRMNHNNSMADYIFQKSNFEEGNYILKNTLFLYKHLNLSENTQFPQLNIPNRAYFVFIGSENTATTLHSHASTFLAQLYGQKLAVLIHPKHADKCGCLSVEGEKYKPICLIDIIEPDYENYPEFKGIEIYHTILEPGDVLYIPDGWLHDIRAISRSITISSGF
jgi:hypothetical protein